MTKKQNDPIYQRHSRGHPLNTDNDLIGSIVRRFQDRLAAEFTYTTSAVSPGAKSARVEIKLIPENLFSDDRNGLFIVVVGRGSVSWSGVEPMNPFKLTAAGVRPLALSEELAHTLNALIERMHSPSSASLPQISDQTVKDIDNAHSA